MSWRRLITPPFWDMPRGNDPDRLNYKRIWVTNFLAAAVITLSPILILGLYLVYHQGSVGRDALWVIAVIAPLLLATVYWATLRQVTKLYQLDLHRSNILREIVYTHKMAAIGRLAAGVAHEINNPMAILREQAGLIQDLIIKHGRDCDPDKILELTRGIQESSRRAGAITHRLLGFGRDLEPRAEELAPGRVIRDVIGLFAEKAKHGGVEVVIEEDPDPPTIISDRSLLEQLLFNLVDNAFSAAGKDGLIRISLKALADREISLAVEDNGPGIAAENLQHIFEPFFSTGGVRNSGLGLSITYGIVHKLGGRIQVQSEAGQGAKFTVTLPLEQIFDAPGRTGDEITERALHAKGPGD